MCYVAERKSLAFSGEVEGGTPTKEETASMDKELNYCNLKVGV